MLIHIEVPLNILRKTISSAYLTLIPLILTSDGVSDKLKTSGMHNLNFELKSQKHDSHFPFS